jgi:thiol-disulfide isomerase/thioredoxin
MRFLLAIVIFFQAAAPQAPVLSLKDTKGRPIRLNDYKGKVVLVNFWATWCAPCLAEMPDLEKLQREYQKKGLQIVGVSYPTEKAPEVTKAIKRLRISYPILLGDEKALSLFKVSDILPVTVIIDRAGKVRGRILGILGPDEFEELVKPLLQPTANEKE